MASATDALASSSRHRLLAPSAAAAAATAFRVARGGQDAMPTSGESGTTRTLFPCRGATAIETAAARNINFVFAAVRRCIHLRQRRRVHNNDGDDDDDDSDLRASLTALHPCFITRLSSDSPAAAGVGVTAVLWGCRSPLGARGAMRPRDGSDRTL